MMRILLCSVWILGLFSFFSCRVPGAVLDQLTDSVDKCLAPFLDIVEARIEGEAGDLTFIMRTRGVLPTLLSSPDDTLIFLWLIDADRNPDTGQYWEKLGADFKIVARIGQRNGGGTVDVIGSLPGGGSGTVTIVKDTIRISIRASQIGFPKEFDWCVADVAMIDGWLVSGNNISVLGSTVLLPNIPPAFIEVFPPMLCLSPTEPTTGQLSALLFDEYGLQLPSDRYTVQYRSSDPSVAAVDSSGVVSLLSASAECDHPVWVSAAVDGQESSNQVLIRGLEGNVPTRHRLWTREHIGLYMPLKKAESGLEQFAETYGVADILETVYRMEKDLSGTVIFHGGKQYYVVDDKDCENRTSGFSGNPIRLNWNFRFSSPSSTTTEIDPTAIPWVRIFHEMGHNFLATSTTFRQLTSTSSPTHNQAFFEGLATLEALWTRFRLIRCGGGLSQSVRGTIEREYVLQEKDFRDRLAAYRADNAVYDLLDSEILAGILYEMRDEFGNKVWFELLSALLPPEESFPITISTPQQQATWFVATLSASTGLDLRERFTTRYGFDLDPQIWQIALETAQERIATRPWQRDNPADLNCDQQVWIEDLWQLAEHWLQDNCVNPWWCGNADQDRDGRVDWTDLDAISGQWLWTNCLPLKL